MTGPEILRSMKNGSTLYSGRFGFWLMDVFNTRCTNVHHGAAKSLVRRKLIERVNDDQWGLPSESQREAAGTADEKGKVGQVIPRDRPWHLYPNGTKAPAVTGGHWVRVTGGWKWNTGDVFPTPGADNMDRVILPPNVQAQTRTPND